MSTQNTETSGCGIAASDLRQPHGHYDEEGTVAPQARVQAALRSFVMDVGAVTALRLESCVHCGMCAEACPFYLNTGDPRFAPIHKVEPLKQTYKREAGPFAPFFKLFGLKRKVTIDELREWEELLFDSCTLCGRCSLICPMGIDITSLIQEARHGMAEAGLVPRGIHAKAETESRTGDALGLGEQELNARLKRLGEEHHIDLPVDRPGAEVMVCTTSEELGAYPATILATVKIMQALGANYSFCSHALDAGNYAYVEGSVAWEAERIAHIVDTARACGVKTLVMPEDAFAYVALRWEGEGLYGQALPFEVKHIIEFLADELEAGRLKLDKAKGDGAPVVFHESCQLARRGGIIEPPLKLLEAMGIEFKRTADHGAFTTCCGGGGGALDNERARPLRYRVFEARMREIEQTGAEDIVTCCSVCRRTFDEGVKEFDWNKRVKGLTELVAERLA